MTPRHLSTPLYVQLSVTNACNLNCAYCCSGSGPTWSIAEPSLPELLRRLDQIADAGALSLVLTGGEPLLRLGDVEELARRAASYNMQVILNTNGTLLTCETAQRLTTLDLALITLNVDGILPETHDRIRGRPGSHRETMEGISNLLQVGMTHRVATVTVVQQGNYREVQDIVRMVDRLGVVEHRLVALCAVGRADELEAETLTKEQWISTLRELEDTKREVGIPVVLGHGLQNFVTRVSGGRGEKTLPDCQAGTTSCYVSATGQVFPCNFLVLPELAAGSLLSQRLGDIWRDATVFQVLRDYSPSDSGCLNCSALSSCRGGCRAWAYLHGHDLLGRDPRCAWFEGDGDRVRTETHGREEP